MKNKFLLVALIAVILMAGMIMVSCNANCPGDGKCYADSKDVAGSVKSWCFGSDDDDEDGFDACIGADYKEGTKAKCGCK